MSSIGEVLQAERQRQERTLPEVSRAVHIKEAYLAALEGNRFDEIPGAVFVKGFIRTYASYLGVDGKALVEVYRQGITPQPPQPDVRLVQQARQRDLKGKKNARKRRNQGRWPEITIVAGLVLFIFLIAWLLV
ncbi:helix-turn-helix domain-containing protein [Megasphaera vaginalis (ex Bordigoni et al. 2020)]|uniref:helix-turn-helix domain-containing protein n=1 Tax=Megasphaera vaginalis (ex Bordigoni et al. 2020) TaxID=2045301 RepID=UPI001F1CA676|nr:helix-turn-helix domain-containing protein [Megasphaera vaginalis (ex Bordigoni et al. 2020)]